MKLKFSIAVIAALGMFASGAGADTIGYCDSVVFTSDTQADQSIVLPAFDTAGGTLTLTGVSVSVTHDGSCDIRGDNDDPFKTADVQARIIRQAMVIGPGVSAFASKTITSDVEHLLADDGDLTVFDPTPPDGHDFGLLTYVDEPAFGSPFSPSPALYADVGTVTFTVGNGQLLMVNDQQFIGTAPDSWQLEVENPLFEIEVCVEYTYIPEPASLSLLSLAGLALLRRR